MHVHVFMKNIQYNYVLFATYVLLDLGENMLVAVNKSAVSIFSEKPKHEQPDLSSQRK